MDGQNFIAQLREIRSNLQEAIRNADNFEYKLTGPRPADTAKNSSPKPPDCVAVLLNEIGLQSIFLAKLTQRHHEIVGDFTPDQCGEPAMPRRA